MGCILPDPIELVYLFQGFRTDLKQGQKIDTMNYYTYIGLHELKLLAVATYKG